MLHASPFYNWSTYQEAFVILVDALTDKADIRIRKKS